MSSLLRNDDEDAEEDDHEAVAWCQFLSAKKAVLGYILSAKRPTFTYISYIHIWKAYASAVNLGYLDLILVHPTRRQSFASKLH